MRSSKLGLFGLILVASCFMRGSGIPTPLGLLPNYTIATLPATPGPGQQVYVTNGNAAAGNCSSTGTDKIVCLWNGAAWVTGASASAGVSSIAGTANQVTASGSTGAVTLSIPANFILPSGTTGTTQAQNDNSTKIATTAYVDRQAPAQLHSVSFVIDGGGSVIGTGDAKVYITADFACTINRWDVSADQSGSVTVDVWKAAGAIPTSGNKISASAPITLSSAQLAQNGSRSGWTQAVSVGDVFGFNVATVATVTRVVGQIWCQ